VALALSASPDDLMVRAEKLAAELAAVVPAEAVRSTAAVGGGGAPGVELPSAAISLPSDLAAALRLGDPPVVGYVARGHLLLDLITVAPAQDRVLAEAVRRAAGSREV
jgi:L-seryl-tRNA(Ser) seleniumtransferase